MLYKSLCKAGVLLLVSSCNSINAEQKRPNIIWIFSDDHSYQTIGAYGDRFAHLNPTPNIDRIQ